MSEELDGENFKILLLNIMSRDHAHHQQSSLYEDEIKRLLFDSGASVKVLSAFNVADSLRTAEMLQKMTK